MQKAPEGPAPQFATAGDGAPRMRLAAGENPLHAVLAQLQLHVIGIEEDRHAAQDFASADRNVECHTSAWLAL